MFLVTFGDSYTADGFNISAGVNSPVLNHTSSNGPNWVQKLGSTYNVNPNMQVFNLASAGATVDAALVPPYKPTVTQFKTFLAPKPAGADWASNNTLFAIWIGINDVGTSSGWTNISQPDAFYTMLMDRLTTQLDILHESGARSFLFLTVPPIDRAPLFIQKGPAVAAKLHLLVTHYNEQLEQMILNFQAKHEQEGGGGEVQISIFDTQSIFNILLDNAQTFGFVNQTGFCEAYQNGTPALTTQTLPCAPVSSYFWLNSLHPLFTIHDALAHAISTALSR